MNSWEVIDYISESILNEIEENCADMKKFKLLYMDFITELESKRALHNNPLSFKDLLLAKEMFKLGYLSAHVVGKRYDKVL